MSSSVLSVSSFLQPKGLYLVGYSWLFGTSVWVTFFGGVIAYRALPRQQFGALQHKTFPIYFSKSILLSSALLGYWTYTHQHILQNVAKPWIVDVFQAYSLAAVLVSQGINHFVIGPMTSKTMFQRHRLEKEEGKEYKDPTVSAEMKALNKRFGMLHGISSLANLISVIALGLHGAVLGNNVL